MKKNSEAGSAGELSDDKKKKRAKELPKARILWLPAFVAVIILSAVFCSEMPLWACILLGIFNGFLSYYFFIVLKVWRILGEKLKHVKEEERLAHENAKAAARRIAEEGIVLLKNEDNLLPLQDGSSLNLFGLGCVRMHYNGGGSAASDESKCLRLEEALNDAGFSLNRKLLNISYNYMKNGKLSIASPGRNYKVKNRNAQRGGAEFIAKPGSPVKAELPVSILTSKQLYPDGRDALSRAKEFSGIALVTLGRGGGEGYDLDPDDLRLIESEKQLLDKVCEHFHDVILLINSANIMEMGWLKEYPSIKSVLWIGFPGTAGNRALADILKGTVNPSGRLPDTWPTDNMDAPAANNFCQLKENGTWDKESFHYQNAPDKKGYFIHYSEGIYVGYRYYETRALTDPAYRYEEHVVWPFGYGMSYTQFKQEIVEFRQDCRHIFARVRVTNVGNYCGKEVVQLYSAPPYTGKLEKSVVSLAAFGKTPLLEPTGSAELEFEIPLKDIASFEEESGKWMLEAGTYGLSLRCNAHTAIEEKQWQLKEPLYFEGSRALFGDADTQSLTRNFDAGHRAFTGPVESDFNADQTVLDALKYHVPTDLELGLARKDMPPLGKWAGLRLKDMKGIGKASPEWDTFIGQLTLPELCHLCGNGAWQTVGIRRLGIPRRIIPDGSTSMAATVFSALVMGKGKAGITWPCPPVLAATFHTDMAELEGKCVGTEANAMGYHGWYAPSLNCHRTAFNSRNFEYYSEDGFLAGKMAATVTKKVQEHKVLVFLKHFALNERETNARNQLFTWCGEQAMREIYFKPFEIAIREGGALGIMSCFNYIGHTWAGGHEKLLTELLVKEWGFEGCIVTDACLYPHMDVAQMVSAGGDLSLDSLGGFTGGNVKRRNLLAAAQDPARRIAMARWLQDAAKDILYAVCQTL